ncbi:MAG: RNA methyltransferase [Acidobacteria bacterium]|nr:RNA methyltransferase [Acidobacteriota bacterium]
MIARIDDAADPRLAPYAMVADPAALARAGLFAAEGRLVAPRLIASAYRVHSLLVSDSALERLRPVLETRPDIDVLVAPAGIISAAGGYDFHRGCLALGYRGAPRELAELLEPGAGSLHSLVVLEGVSNPDNIGGLFRSAHAFAARGVILAAGCGDPLYRKAIRTSMGATLDVPWAAANEWPADLGLLTSRGYRVIAMTTDAGAPPLRDAIAHLDRPAALLFGSEGYGLSRDALAAADVQARIPMPNAGADSLNVVSAASIALYEARPRVR